MGGVTAFDDHLATVLTRCVPGFSELVSAERLSAGASQETYRITIVADGIRSVLAMRRAAGGVSEKPDDTRPGLPVEAELMRVAKAAGVPEPTIIEVLDPADGLGLGFIMEWLDGETLGSRILRSDELAQIRPKLAFQCGEILAKIHAIDPHETGLVEHLTVVPTEDFVRRMWEQYHEFASPQPMIDFTARWLLDHLPPDDEPQLVHNDFRNGNFMVTPDGISAVLDWEVAHLGDPIRDLGWICTNSWRFGRRDLPVGGFGERGDLLDGYESVSGIRVSEEHVHFWEVFGSFWWAIGCINMAHHWRTGPDQTVERPGIARRSSECQVDCVNLLVPGPVTVVESTTPASSTDTPSVEELLTSVSDFLRNDLRPSIEGRNGFLSLVASNSLEIAKRELTLGPAHLAAEHARLEALLSTRADLDSLRWQLTNGLRSGEIDVDMPGLHSHLRATVVNQVAIDQPKYSGLTAALAADHPDSREPLPPL